MLRKKPSVKLTEFQKNIALRFSYDGSRYSGLASQKNDNTIDFQLKKALINSNLANPDVKITYAGRTDSGVSGINMVASLLVYALPDDRSFNYDIILNSHLPPEIRITGYTFVSLDFNARYSCKKRSYTYFFLKNSLNIQKMRLACKFILSQTNFKYFCKGHKEEEDKYFYRPISSLEILEEDICKMNVSSVSFLHNMVRKIFYVVRLVGDNKINLEELCEYFEGKRPVGTADPEFLLFIGAEYDNLKFKHNLRGKEKEFLTAHVSKIVHENVFEIEKNEQIKE